MDSLLANIATFAAPVCTLIAFLWVVAIKKPHDTEEQYNRELLNQQLKTFSETLAELKEAINTLSKELKVITKDNVGFGIRLNNLEKDIEILKK